ncbi:MAG: restriction endonuclease subunit S [Saprospirales bacterium]|nr:restriction endonuclease subunit S [Saprospirales bacterium]
MEVMNTKTEVRLGYKKTEVGVIPKDWIAVNIGEITTPSRKRIFPQLSQDSFSCIELEHISQNTGQLLGQVDSKLQLSQKTVFSSADVLFGKLRPYLKKFLYPGFSGLCSTEIWALQPSNRVEGKFLFYLVQSHLFIEAANQSTGTKMPRAEWKVVKETFVPLPPTLTEQRAIATALSDADDLIAALDRLIAKKKAIKQGLCRSC